MHVQFLALSLISIYIEVVMLNCRNSFWSYSVFLTVTIICLHFYIMYNAHILKKSTYNNSNLMTTFDESYVECLLGCKLHMHLSVYCKLLQLRCGGRQSFCYTNISLMAACPYFCQRSLVSLARGMFFSCSLLNLGANLSVMGLESVNVWH